MKDNNAKKWGGVRAGSGAKTADGAVIVERVSTCLCMDQLTADVVFEFGGGNASLAVRRMAAEIVRLRAGVSIHCTPRVSKHAYASHTEEAPPRKVREVPTAKRAGQN